MRARITLLSGPNDGRRFVLKEGEITIGGDPSHAVSLPGLSTTGVLATIERRGALYRIRARDERASLAVNGLPVQETVLGDGDVIRIAGKHRIRFGVVPDRGEASKPVRDIVRGSLEAAAALEAGRIRRGLFFLRDVCHCTACDATRRVKLACLGTCALVVAGLLLVGVGLLQSRAASDRRLVAVSEEVAAGIASRRRLEEEIAGLRELEKARADEIARELEAAERRLTLAERRAPDLSASIEAARRSVAFLLVGYALFESASGNPLRFDRVDANGAPEPDESGGYPTSVDGPGPVVTSYATGSGFLVTPSLLVTNRHVVEPWWQDPSVEGAAERGFEPRRTVMLAYFPDLRRPVELRAAKPSGEADVAVVETGDPTNLSPLTLAPPEQPVRPGELIAVVAYPAGLSVLLAKADRAVAERIMDGAGEDWPALARALADEGLITPLVTVGHVGDVLESNVVYDAATTEGSSGGPALNAAGEVIALNYAGMSQFAGARFGIPVRFVHRLLEEKAR